MEEARYLINYTQKADKQIKKLPKTSQYRIKDAIEKKLFFYPEEFSKPLRHRPGEWSLRAGEYRIVFFFDSENEILINDIFHRKRGY